MRVHLNDLVVEQLARRVHEAYLHEQLSRGAVSASRPALVGWDQLPESLREANRAQVRSYEALLASVSLEITTMDPGFTPIEFTGDELEQLASLEHARWLEAAHTSGAQVPSELDVQYHDLPERERQKDRDVFLRMLPLLADFGLALRRQHVGEGQST